MSTSTDKKVASYDANGAPGLMAHNRTTNETEQVQTKDGGLVTSSKNIDVKFREAFEIYEPVTDLAQATPTTRWLQSVATGDFVILDGNAVGASYLVISKDPLTTGGETIIESVIYFDMPWEAVAGYSMSQRTTGQELYWEVVDTDTPAATPGDIAISSITQSGTTLTITTATAHGLIAGKRFGIKNCIADSRLNYQDLVVSSITSPTVVVATAGPRGTIPSVTVGPLSSNVGSIFYRPTFKGAGNGMNLVMENTTATQASGFVRSEFGDAFPTGTRNGNQSITTVGSSSSVQLVNTAYTYAFGATTEYRMVARTDKIQISDAAVDSLGEQNNRFPLTQVVPNHTKKYKIRYRFKNVDSLTIPVGQILSITKTSATVSRVVFAAPHGLTLGDQINLFGVRDQTANVYPNITTATAITTIVDASTIDIAHGTVSGTVSYGGFVSRVNGGINQQGVLAQVIQSAVLTTSGSTRLLTLTGSAAWTGALIGDYVNVVGCRNIVNGGTMGVDAAYRVRNIATTSLELELLPGQTIASDFGSTNCGGAVIRRTDARISYIRVYDWVRERFEMLGTPAGDASTAAGVNIKASTTLTVNANSSTAVDSVMQNPFSIGGRASNANITAMSATGDLVGWMMTMIGVGIVKPYAIPEADWVNSITLTTAADVALQAAAGAGIKRYLTALQVQNTSAVATTLIIKDGTTARWTVSLPASMTTPIDFVFPTPIPTTANAALNAAAGTTGANVIVNGQGYTAP